MKRLLSRLLSKRKSSTTFDSRTYWQERYSRGGNSGPGSYNHLAEFKARTINGIVKQHEIQSVAEFGCGDGNQLTLAEYPAYVGIDVSDTALERCRRAFFDDASKKFVRLEDSSGETAELTLSLDVIYHLTEDSAFHDHIERLFSSAQRLVVIYSSDMEDAEDGPSHVRHRQFTKYVAETHPAWRLREVIKNEYPYVDDYKSQSFSDFYVYEYGEGRVASDS